MRLEEEDEFLEFCQEFCHGNHRSDVHRVGCAGCNKVLDS